MNFSQMAETFLVPLRRLLPVLSKKKQQGIKVVFTNGCFDILHVGHISYLERAKSLGDVLVVGLNSDASVRKLKGPGRPVNTAKDRARVLAALRAVDYVTVFSADTPLELIRSVRPDCLVKGGDWKAADIVGGSFVKSCGGKVRSLPFVKRRSTSGVLAAIQKL